MAKQLIPEELRALIDQYLTDGVLTDKERAVILKKAESMGLDRDEIDLYLDAEVQKIDQATDAAVRKQKGKTCPYCGGSVPQLTDKCPHCGENITPEASKELQEIFDNLEEALVNLKSAKDIHTSKAVVERYARKAKMYYGSNPKVQKLLEEIETETINAEKKAISLARKNIVVSVLTYNKALTACVVVALLIAIVWGVSSWLIGPDVKEDPQACIEAVKDALDKGNVEKAAGLCKGFRNGSIALADRVSDAYALTALAYIENNEYDKAISLFTTSNLSLRQMQFDMRKRIVDLCVDKGDYDKAEDYGLFDYDGYKRYFDYICKCVDHMQKIGTSKEDIKRFIDRKIGNPDPGYGNWDSKKDPQRLYEYAGLK